MTFGFGAFNAPLSGDPDILQRLAAARLPTAFSGDPGMGLPQRPDPGFGVQPVGAFGFGSMPTVAPMTTPLPPARPSDNELIPPAAPTMPAPPFGFGGPKPAAPQADLPVPGAVSAAAPGFTPAIDASPAPSQTASTSEPSFGDAFSAGLKRFQANDGFDLLGSLGIGLMSTRGFGQGLAAGLLNHQQQEKSRAAQKLAGVETALKLNKLQREAGGENQTVELLVRNGYPRETAQAYVSAAAGGNREALSNALNRLSPKPTEAPSGYTVDGTGRASFIPGGPQDPTTIAAQSAARAKEEAPIVKTFNVGGSKVERVFNRATGQWEEPSYGASPPTPAAGDGLDVPPGVDPTTYRKELARATVATQKAATGRAMTAQSMMGVLDRAENAYRKLGQLDGIGPYSASGFNRTIGGMRGSDTEVLRQDYEAAAKELELAKAQISMKGQGSITDSERRLLALTLPRLDAANPRTGLTTLQGVRKQYQDAVGAETLPTYGRGRGAGMAAPPSDAIQHLRQNPSLRDAFDAKYGAGAAARALGGM